jgi:LmbE family N-acetylglucosaminyl deacetylase
MKLDFSSERVLAVVAHPDDAELLCAGTLARAKEDGAAIAICVLCQGDKGQPATPIPNLAEVRSREVGQAAQLIGAELFPGQFADGELADGTTERQALIAVYRQFRPTLVLAHAPADYHPDHRAASALADAASWFCASGGYLPQQRPLDTQPALWWMDTINMSGFEPGFFVDISDFAAIKHQMLRCHKSQLARWADRDFSPLEELMRKQYSARGAQAGAAAAEAFEIHRAWKRIRAW